MSVSIPVFPEGTRVKVKRGSAPIEEALVGRTGRVVRASEYAIHQYHVLMDGEQRVETFAPSELEVLEALALPPETEKAKGRLSRP
ncbi:MAG TPA: hypothetical protein VMK65_04910 [Longimicrobiales bacterium]|nr:hypothetical protein [Longimicrobiales bacterium]